MADLNRVQVGSFNIQDSIKIDNFKKEYKNTLITIEEFFKNNNKIILESKEMVQFLNGVKIPVKREDELYKIYDGNNSFIGIGIVKQGLLKRDIII